MLLAQLLEIACMQSRDIRANEDFEYLISMLLRSYGEMIKLQLPDSLANSPKMSPTLFKKALDLGCKNPNKTTNPQSSFSLIDSQKPTSPLRSVRSDLTHNISNKLSESFSDEIFNRHKSTSMMDRKRIYTNEEYSILEHGYRLLHREASSEEKILAINVRQFFLDCYIGLDSFMTVLNTRLCSSKWITCHQFLLCLDDLQTRVLDKPALYVGEIGSHKKAIEIQRFIFFFKFIELIQRRDLNVNELRIAVSMSLKGRKNFTEDIVNSAMSCILFRLADIPISYEKISFDDFYYALRDKRTSFL